MTKNVSSVAVKDFSEFSIFSGGDLHPNLIMKQTCISVSEMINAVQTWSDITFMVSPYDKHNRMYD